MESGSHAHWAERCQHHAHDTPTSNLVLSTILTTFSPTFLPSFPSLTRHSQSHSICPPNSVSHSPHPVPPVIPCPWHTGGATLAKPNLVLSVTHTNTHLRKKNTLVSSHDSKDNAMILWQKRTGFWRDFFSKVCAVWHFRAAGLFGSMSGIGEQREDPGDSPLCHSLGSKAFSPLSRVVFV